MHVTTGYIDVNISTNLEIRQQQNCVQFTLRVSTVFTYRRIEPVILRGAKPPILGQGEARRTEAIRGSKPQTADGWGFGGGHWLRGLGDRCKLPQWGPGRSRGREKVLLHSRGTRWPLLELVGAQFGGPVAPFGPLKSACDESRREFGIFARLVRQPSGVTFQSLI